MTDGPLILGYSSVLAKQLLDFHRDQLDDSLPYWFSLISPPCFFNLSASLSSPAILLLPLEIGIDSVFWPIGYFIEGRKEYKVIEKQRVIRLEILPVECF